MKKNLPIKLATLAIMLTFITGSLVSGTFAKYTTAVTGAQQVRVAKFAFNLKDGTGTFTQSQSEEASFDIFSYTDSGVYANGVNGGAKFIAPGTSGDLQLQVENLSEVDVAVSFALTEANASSIPIYYTIGAAPQRYSSVLTGAYGAGAEAGTYQGIVALATDMATAAGSLEANDGTDANKTTFAAPLKLNWVWAFESAGDGQTDAGDTALGTAASPPTVKLSVVTTVTQKD